MKLIFASAVILWAARALECRPNRFRVRLSDWWARWWWSAEIRIRHVSWWAEIRIRHVSWCGQKYCSFPTVFHMSFTIKFSIKRNYLCFRKPFTPKLLSNFNSIFVYQQVTTELQNCRIFKCTCSSLKSAFSLSGVTCLSKVGAGHNHGCLGSQCLSECIIPHIDWIII